MEKIRTRFDHLDVPRFLKAPVDRRVKKPRTTIVMLHGIGNSAAGWNTVKDMLPDDARVIAIDLLGFGASPKPTTASYNVRIQARSVAATLLKMRLSTRVIIIGHSMGSLIATEIAKRYPLLVRGLILCSPPIYRSIDDLAGMKASTEQVLRKVYNVVGNDILTRPQFYIGLSQKIAGRVVVSDTFRITDDTINPYVVALRASIMDQTTYKDIQALQVPVRIIYGTLDPFVVGKNFKRLAKKCDHISVKSIIAGHEVRKSYIKPILQAVDATMHQM